MELNLLAYLLLKQIFFQPVLLAWYLSYLIALKYFISGLGRFSRKDVDFLFFFLSSSFFFRRIEVKVNHAV